jgi:8-amino-7-oxononanoate synthase
VDEAHATGVLGPDGRGLAAELDLAERVHATMGTLSKALGSLGGFIAGARDLADWLANRARSFIYTTAPPPAQLAAAREALRIACAERWRREQCLSLAKKLRAALAERGFDTGASSTQIVPVILGKERTALSAAAFLAERGLHAPAIRPPTVPVGTARLRLSVTAGHTEENIACLVETLAAWRNSAALA